MNEENERSLWLLVFWVAGIAAILATFARPF